MKCSLEQCFFSYAALTYEQHVSVFFFFFVVFIVSDLNDLIYTSRGTRWGEIISVSDLYEI